MNKIISSQVKSVVQYVSDVMHVKWRGLLSTKLHLGYFTKDAYYKLNVLQDIIDNPYVFDIYLIYLSHVNFIIAIPLYM